MSRLVEDLLRESLTLPFVSPGAVVEKQCSLCEIVHPIGSFNQNKGNGKTSSSIFCRDCRKSRRKDILGDRDKEKINERGRKRYHENIEQNQSRAKEYYSKNKQNKKKPTPNQKVRKNKKGKERWWDRREDELRRGRDYYAANKGKIDARIAEYRRLNPDVMRNYQSLRRAQMAKLQINVTRETIAARIEVYGHNCAYCGKPYEHLDHVKAVSRNGFHSPSNLRPSCKTCNLRKGKMSIKDWYRISGPWTGLPVPNLPW